MSNPIETKRRIRDFLVGKTNLKIEIIKKIALKNLKEIAKTTNSDIDFTDNQIIEYITQHYIELSKEADTKLDLLCNEIIPEPLWKYLLKQFALISCLLLPSLIPLGGYAYYLYKSKNIHIYDFGICFFSIVSILIIVTSSIIIEFIKKNR